LSDGNLGWGVKFQMAHVLAGPFEQMPRVSEPGAVDELQVYMGLAGHDAADHAVVEIAGHPPTNPLFNVGCRGFDSFAQHRHDCTVRLTQLSHQAVRIPGQ
jgi:hypothetical protein